MRLCCIILLLGICANAQTINDRIAQPFVVGNLGILSNLGYENPVTMAGVGMDVDTPKLFVSVESSEAWDRKIETRDGHTFMMDAGAFVRFGRMLAGGGDRYSALTTSQYSKSGNRPFAGIGYDGVDMRVIGEYLMPWLDVQNALQGPRLTIDAKANTHWHVVFAEGLYRYHDTRVSSGTYSTPAAYHFGAETSLGIKFVF